MAEEKHFAQDVYAQLALLGVDPHEVVTNYVEGEGRVAIAVPSTRIALSIEGDTPEPLVKAGWYVVSGGVAELRTFSNVFSRLGALGFEHVRRRSESRMLKTGSKEEGMLLRGILEAGLAEPDRNHVIRRPNGTELTVPDFAWVDLRLAFFVDGLWWHATKDDAGILDQLQEVGDDKERRNQVLEGNKTRVERDAGNRSELVADGWRVLVCTDRDLHREGGVEEQVERIVKLMRTIARESSNRGTAPAAESAPVADSTPSVDDLLS